MDAALHAGVVLTRRDIMVFEHRLKELVAELFPFKGHSLVFPRTAQPLAASWLDAENRLLLPLSSREGVPLGIFVARGVDPAVAGGLSPYWPALNLLVTDALLLYKRSLCDPVTGLFTRHYLLERMEREMDVPRESLRAANAEGGGSPDVVSPGRGLLAGGAEALHRGSVGILVLRMTTLRDVVRDFGYRFADTLMIALAGALTERCPEQGLAARIGDLEFAVLLPAATPKTCRALAETLAAELPTVFVEHPLRRERVGTVVSTGFALYPQDMDGGPVRAMPEQARVLLRKARLAAALAGEHARPGTGGVMAFSRILAEGGRVLESLPLSRVMVSLGAGVHAHEGQHFSVWAPVAAGEYSPSGADVPPLYKGELVLMDVGENASYAEIVCLGDPAWTIEPGDRLTFLPGEQGTTAPGVEEPRRDPMTGLLRHSDFLAQWAEKREAADTFVLSLIRLAPRTSGLEESFGQGGDPEDAPGAVPSSGTDSGDGASRYAGQMMAGAARFFHEELPRDALAGRYGLNSLVIFHPGGTAAAVAARYEEIVPTLAQRLGVDVAVGLACHPCLDFRKSDALENSRKALEYAMLLPHPHVGVLDSLALNISADKRFSQGDSFGAIKEYQLALLLDENNGMAWNSLGICLAGLGRHAEAERCFTRAIACLPDDPMALYNLGYMYQSRKRPEEARARYQECLRHSPEHLYALVRLGQLHEHEGDMTAARLLYEQAAEKPGGDQITRRHFARVCIAEGKRDEAREHLHEALIHDPQDALAMQMLARLYLDAGEDPDIAASLARQSVSLRPGLKSGWLELARALDAMGQTAHAREARFKAV